MKVVIAVDHLAGNNNGYSYYELDAKNLGHAKNLVFLNYHKFSSVYLVKILAKSRKEYEYRQVCNLYKSGSVEICKSKDTLTIYPSQIKKIR